MRSFFIKILKPISELPHYISERGERMSDHGTVYEELAQKYCEKFMGKVFYFCLKKTENIHEAEDLTQDISLNVIYALSKGALPESFSAYVWQIARNRYSAWAEHKRRKREAVTGNHIADYELEDESENITDEMIRNEELSLLRRELAFIGNEYRSLLIAYYIEGKSVRAIADALSIPEGTVKSKLFRARKILKEGMNMAREFGKKSYNPQSVSFVSSGSQPSGLPWRVIQRQIPQNILLHASNNPSTVEELALELGIAAPYMEEEVEILYNATLLKKVDGDKYITDFFIMDKEAQLEIYGILRQGSLERSGLIDELVEENLQAFRGLGIANDGISDNTLKWWLVIHTVDFCVGRIKGYNSDWPEKRANGEQWGILGFEWIDPPERTVMGHNGNGNEDFMFWAYKIPDYNLWDQVSEMSFNQTILLGSILAGNRNLASLSDAEALHWKTIDGKYAHSDGDGNIIPDILAINNDQMKKLDEIIASHPNFKKIMENYQLAFDSTVKLLEKYSHSVLHKILPYCVSSQMYGSRMMTVHDEVNAEKLLLPKNPKTSVLGMHIRLS